MIDEAPQEAGSPYATRSVQNAPLPCLGQGVHLLETMIEAASRAAPLAEPAASRLDALERAPAPVCCECSIRSHGSRYLCEAKLLGLYLHGFDQDFSAFQQPTAGEAAGLRQQARQGPLKRKAGLSVPKITWTLPR